MRLISRRRRARVYEASTPLQLAALSTIIAQEGDGNEDLERILLLSSNNDHPECEGSFLECPETVETVSHLFTRVLSLNELVFPYHPSGWNLESDVSASFLQHFEGLKVERLALESLQVPPAQTLAEIFRKARITVYADGLMAYSPTRFKLDDSILRRVQQLHFFDLVDGVSPLLLQEAKPELHKIDLEGCRRYFHQLALKVPSRMASLEDSVVLLGQSLHHAKVLSFDQEVELYVQAVAASRRKFPGRPLFFKPHSTCQVSIVNAVLARSRSELDMEVRLLRSEVPVEALLETYRPAAMVGVFSTALQTAAILYDVPCYSYGAIEVLLALPKFENSNRIPLVLSSLTVESIGSHPLAATGSDRLSEAGAIARKVQWTLLRSHLLGEVVQSVGYCMQPELLESLLPEIQHGEWFMPAFAGLHRVFYLGHKSASKHLPLPKLAAARELLEAGEVARAAYCAAQALYSSPESTLNAKLLARALAELGEDELHLELAGYLEGSLRRPEDTAPKVCIDPATT